MAGPVEKNSARSPVLRVVAALMGALGVAAAAYGAHGIERIAGVEQVRWWAIGAAIQLVSAPAALVIALHGHTVRAVSGWLLSVGVLLFSGTLQAMALGAPRWFGAITPLGGLCMIAGWLLVVIPRAQTSRASSDGQR